jgi:plasmid stability protein
MRTTLNLDDDVAEQLSGLARAQGRSISRVANALMRDGLRASRSSEDLPPYEPPAFDTGRALVDLTDVQEALERLDERD